MNIARRATTATPQYLGLEPIVALLRDRAGLVVSEHRRELTWRGALRAMQALGLTSLAALHDAMVSSPAALDTVLGEVTIGETWFFRHVEQFELIRRQVLPQLQASRGPGAPIRLWSAACATGEEAYSLAVVLARAGLPAEPKVLATDISRPALAKARIANYSAWSLRGAGRTEMAAHLVETAHRFQLSDEIRRRVKFRYLNLASEQWPSAASAVYDMDVILCRNALLYLDVPTIAAVATRLCASLAVGGWLITGPADPRLGELARLETVVTEHCAVYRKPPPALLVSLPEWSPPVLRMVPPPARIEAPVVARTAASVAPAEDTEALASRVRRLADTDPRAALAVCTEALLERPLAMELRVLHVVLLVACDDKREAVAAARRAIYVQASSEMAHLLLGDVLARSEAPVAAARAFRTAVQLLERHPQDHPVAHADGERAGQLARAAIARLARLPQTSRGNS